MYDDEARRVRGAIDRAVIQVLSPAISPRPLVVNEGVEDLRDEFTRWLDTLILAGATVPSYIERRLDAAFDAEIEHAPGSSDG